VAVQEQIQKEEMAMPELASRIGYGFKVMGEVGDDIDRFREISSQVLLAGGSTSPQYIKNPIIVAKELKALKMIREAQLRMLYFRSTI